MMAETERGWGHKVAEWYSTLPSKDSEGYFLYGLIKSTLTLMLAVPVIKTLEAFVFVFNNILFNSILKIPGRPLMIVDRPVTEVVVYISDLAIVFTYAAIVLFGFLNLVVKEVKELCKQIRDKQ